MMPPAGELAAVFHLTADGEMKELNEIPSAVGR